RCRRLRADDLEGRAEAIHQAVRPGPRIIEAADGAVVELEHRIERVLVAGAQHLALHGKDTRNARTADPLHRIDIVNAHVEEDRTGATESPCRGPGPIALGAQVDRLTQPRRVGGLENLYVAQVESQDVANHQPHAVTFHRR